MSHVTASAGHLPRRLLLVACLLLPALSARVEAQRQPESAGALPYYRDSLSVFEQPEWRNRGPFVRGPLDRYQRGRDRTFLGTEDAIPYLNYADENYVCYLHEAIPWTQLPGRRIQKRNVRWDRLGEYMGAGYQKLFSWEETRSSSDSSGYSYIDHYNAGISAMRIGNYSYKSLNWTATVGTDVRSVFTPLTLVQGHNSCARIDLDAQGKDKFTLLFNHGRAGLFSQWGNTSGDTYENTPVLMYAAHYQHDFGGYARLGTTFLNQFVSYPRSPHSSSFRGDLPYDMLSPKAISVYVGDDSPAETRFNGRVYSVDIIVEGQRNGVAVTLTSIAGAAQRSAQAGADAVFDARLAPVVTGGTLRADGSRVAVGKETVVYAFTLPTDVAVHAVRFAADVADDYRIGVRQTHDVASVDIRGKPVMVEEQWPAAFNASDAGTRLPFKWSIDLANEVPYYTVARAPSGGVGGANRALVSFDYGMPTGQSLAGADFNADLVGLKVSGELVGNLQNFIFPVGENQGERHSKTAFAGWVTALKDLPRGAHLGAELYRLDPDYSGDYDSQRGGMAFHLDQTANGRVKNVTQEFPLVEDNDDHDQWADEASQEVLQSGVQYPGWPNSGTYPGLDENNDNIPDVDRNENFVWDWQEPFLMYDADPPDFVYGVDLNNNGVPDFRENDDLPDYPYPRNQQGHHLFLRLDRLGGLGKWLTVGYYSNRQLAGVGEDRAYYLRYLYEAKRTLLGDVRFNYDLKQVKDDITNPTYMWLVPPNDVNIIQWIDTPDRPPDQVGFQGYRPATPDPLAMRDSWVNTAFLAARYEASRGLVVENSAQWSRNSQAQIAVPDSGLLQAAAVHSKFAMVNKVEYKWNMGQLTVRPRLKHRLLYANVKSQYELLYEGVESGDRVRTSTTDVIPIILAEYQLTPNTQFLGGMEGLPGLPYKHWDRVDENQTYGQSDYLAMFKIHAEYQGIGTTYYLGYQRERRSYSHSSGQDYKNGTLFAQVISAF